MSHRKGCGATTMSRGIDLSGLENLIGLAFDLPRLASSVAGTLGSLARSGSTCGCRRCRPRRDDCRRPKRSDCCDGCEPECGGCERCAPDTDLHLEVRFGELKLTRILIENNQGQPVTIQLAASPWIDACGRQVPATNVTFTPVSVGLQPGHAAEVRIEIKAAPPLEEGMVYYGEITFSVTTTDATGQQTASNACCPPRPISVALCVAPDLIDHYAVTDPCRKRRGRFVDLCREPCCCEPCCCEDEDCCCESKPVDPWAACGWPGTWDPHRHWLESCSCRRYCLPPRTRLSPLPHN